MVKKKLKGWIITWTGFAIGFVIGLFIAYMVHIQWHFFGANFVDLKNIIFLWVGCPFLIGFWGLYLGAIIGERI